MDAGQKGLMKGLVKTGLVFSAVLVATLMLFYVLPVFAGPGITLTHVAPSPVNASNVSTVGTQGYFFVNFTVNESLVSIPILQVYNLSGGGAVGNYPMTVNGTDATANYASFNVTGLANGTFEWIVTGVNTSSLGDNQTFGNFTVTLGQIYAYAITNPVNNTNTTTNPPAIKVSANSTFLTNLSVTIYNITGSTVVTMTNTTILNGTETSFTLTGIGLGEHTIIVEVGSSADFKVNTTALTLNVSSLTTTITSPVNNTNTTDFTPDVKVSANSSQYANLSLTLYTNKAGVIQAIINTTILNATETTFTLPALTNGTYDVLAEVGNSADLKQNASALRINIDTTAPETVVITNPVNNTNTSDFTPNIKVSVNDSIVTNLSLKIITNKAGVIQVIQNTTILNGTETTFTLSALTNGTYNVIVEAMDNALSSTNSTALTLNIDTDAPIISITNPVNNTNTSDFTPTIKVSANDSSATNMTLTLYSKKGAVIQAIINTTILNATETSFDLTALSNGTYEIIAEAKDLVPNTANSSFLTVNIDTSIPVVAITNPANSTNTNDLTPEIRVSANDTSLTQNMTLTIYTNKAGVIQAIINTTILNATETYFNLSQLSTGTYNIIAEAKDSVLNSANSTALTIVVRSVDANATVNVASTIAGGRNNYTFTIASNGTDNVDMINISYSASGYGNPALGDIVCPNINGAWNRSLDATVKSVVCLLADPNNDPLISGSSTTLKIENWSATNTAGLKTFSVVVRGLSGGGTATVSNSPSTSVYGNLSITGTSRVATTTQIGSTNVTIISFNFSATGEQMNITGLNITLNGTQTEADIVRVGLYNSSADEAGLFDGSGVNHNLIQWNTSAPVSGRYNFSNIGLNITAGTTNVLLVVVNMSSTATGGRTLNASIEGAADVVTTGSASGQSITETFTSQRSSSSTIYGTLAVTGTDRVSATTQIGTNNVTLVSYNFTAIGEAMNVSEILLQLNGTSISEADIQSITLYNSTDPSTATFNGSQTRLKVNSSAPTSLSGLVYNLSGFALSVPTGATGQIVLVVVNVSSGATAGHRINATILSNANIATTSAVSGQGIAETLTTPSSTSTIIVGTLAVTGISQVATTTQIGSTNVTIISFNFTAAGEQMNITGLNITLNGTQTVNDIDRVGLYNGTGGYDLIQWNTSAPVSGRYNFSNIGFNVSVGTNVLLVVVNLTDTAIGGHTFNASIEGAADVVTTGGGSAQAITETFATQRSSSSTIYGNLSVTGTNIAPSAADTGQIGVGLLKLTLNSTGEMINVTGFNITSNSTSKTDVLAVKIYSDSGGATTGTYERGSDLPIAGASGAFTGSSVILAPTTAIQIENNTLSYVYVVIDVNTSATIGNSLGVSIQGASAITAVGNNSNVTLTSQLITGDPGGTTSIKNLTATGTLIVTGSATAQTSVGTKNNYTFTINNTGTGTSDSIDQISIDSTSSGFTAVAAGEVTCPTVNLVTWDKTVSGNVMICNVSNSGARLAVNKNVTILYENFTAGATAGVKTFSVSVRGASGGIYNITTSVTVSVPNVTVYGNLTVTGTNRVNATVQIGSTGITLISFNLSAAGEAMNVSEIVLMVNGTSISSADIQSVSLYNSTDSSTTQYIAGTQTRLATNTTVTETPTSLTYNFSSLGLSVPTGTTGQIVLVVINMSSSATGGHTINGTILSNANIVTVGGLTGVSVAETVATMSSSTSTIFGTLAVTGTSRVASTTVIGTGNVTIISFNFTAAGESMNITGLNITINGTQTEADIVRVGLYNSSAAAAGVLDGSGVNYDLIQWNTSAPVSGRYNFSNIGFNVSVGTNVLLVVINMSSSATGGRTLNASIEGAADVVTTAGGSAQAITETFASQRSGSSVITGALSITGTSRVASYTRLGSTNVTVISFNFSATGEQMNISEIIVTRNGTAGNADVVEVKLYNSTRTDAGVFNGTPAYDPIATNTSEPVNGRYNFSSLSFNVPSSQIVLVVFNMSSTATGGNTFNASIEGAADVVTTGGGSAQAITETFATQRSGTSTLSALSITGTSRVASTTAMGSTNVTIISFNFTATGEQMNITSLNITFNGTHTTADIVRVGLYNSSAAAAGVLDGSGVNYDLIQWNTSAPLNGRYNFSNIGFNVSVGTNVLLVVVNVSSTATGGRTFNASIEEASDVVVSGGVSALSITPTFASQRSGNSTIYGTLSITGTNRVASYTRLGSTNVTIISFNFSATGEQMNISSITVARTGTVTDADIVSVALYNSTQENAQTFNETLNIDPLAVNTTPVDGAYTFSGLSFVVPSSQILIVVFNVSSSATGGGVFGAGITSAASVTTTSSSSGQSIIETLSGHVSGNSTLSALAVTGGTVAPSTISVGQSATGFLNLTFAATGETMNITSINITLTGNGTALNLSDVRIYRDEATAPGRFDSSDTFLSRGDFNGASVELNLTPNIYNVSIPIGTTIFFITYNVSAIALNGSTVSAQIIPSSSVSAVGNASGLAISVTGSSLASSNATIQSQARLTFSTIVSSVTWLTNSTTGPNSTTITVPVTNAGHATATLTSVVATMYNAVTAENASTNFTITRADSVTTIAGGVTTTLNFTVNATTASQLNGLVNVSVTLAYNDSNTLVASANSPSETNTSGLFGLDGGLPTVQIVLPSNNAFKKGTQDINFTLNDTTSGVNNLSLSFQVNGTARTATCTPNQLNFTCTFSWATSNGTYTDGVYTLTVNVNDNATNSAIKSEVNVTVDNTAPALSGDNVTVSLINTTITTLFSVNITERNFNASNTFIGVRNLTNATVRNMEASCASLSSDVWRCNATWNGKDDSAANVVDGNYTFFANSTDNLSTYGTFNSTMVVTFTSDTGAPSITGSGPSGTITSTTPALLVNTSEPATCKFDNSSTTYSSMAYAMTGTSLTHNYTLWTLSDGTYTFYVRCQDAIGNAMTASETISFTKSTTAPVISSVANSTVTAYSAIINWTTDTSSSSIVEYGTNTSSMISSAEYDIVPRVTSHSVALNNLEKGTLYYYRVVSKDASGNRVNSTISNFTTADNITQWLGAGWNINFVLPSQTIMENRGYNASNTGNFNFTSILSSLGTNWNYMHYNINGTSAGWVLATRTDPGGSTLKYVNNTNDKYYSINITAPGGVRFVL